MPKTYTRDATSRSPSAVPGSRVSLEEQRSRVTAAVERLTALGATYVGEKTEQGVHWAVLLDPEGNEFCA